MITPTQAQSDIRDARELDLLVIAPAGCGKTEAGTDHEYPRRSTGSVGEPPAMLSRPGQQPY
jgi:hypothetical protein